MEIQTGEERRVEPRNQLSHEFIVAHPILGERMCMSEDVSLHGAFLVGDFSSVSVGSTIGISFLKQSRRQDVTKATRYRFNATVIRVTERGAGVRFQGLNTEIDAAIFDLMHRGA